MLFGRNGKLREARGICGKLREFKGIKQREGEGKGMGRWEDCENPLGSGNGKVVEKGKSAYPWQQPS